MCLNKSVTSACFLKMKTMGSTLQPPTSFPYFQTQFLKPLLFLNVMMLWTDLVNVIGKVVPVPIRKAYGEYS